MCDGVRYCELRESAPVFASLEQILMMLIKQNRTDRFVNVFAVDYGETDLWNMQFHATMTTVDPGLRITLLL